MRPILPDQLEAGRMRDGPMGSTQRAGHFGMFHVQGPCGELLRIISSGACAEAEGWEHVSVSTRRRVPNWQEMSFVKRLFWEPEECVVQFHPPESTYVNNHPHVLHLWRHESLQFPLPPSILVGIKALGELSPEEGRAAHAAYHR